MKIAVLGTGGGARAHAAGPMPRPAGPSPTTPSPSSPNPPVEHPWPTPWGVMPELDPCHTDAKQRVTDPLRSYGWTLVRNLGPLVCARGRERYAHLHSAIGFGLGRHFGGHFGIEVER